MPKWHYQHDYILDVDESRLMIIRTQGDLNVFTELYGVARDRGDRASYEINWAMVASDYAGIEIPDVLGWGGINRWYYGWDVGSGCIWNVSAIRNIEEIKQPVSVENS